MRQKVKKSVSILPDREEKIISFISDFRKAKGHVVCFFSTKKGHILLFPIMTYDIVFSTKNGAPECKPEWNREAITVFPDFLASAK